MESSSNNDDIGSGVEAVVAPIIADPSVTTSYALVAYLRMEADLAEEKAKRLRAQAAALCARFGITEEIQSRYELNPSDLPPVDENGVPKYSGKKRGRKPKPRTRKHNPNRRKRQHTAYTLFVQETYPNLKLQHPQLQSKDLISMVAKTWKSFSPADKKAWKDRAQATHVDEDDDAEDEEEEEEDSAEVVVGGTSTTASPLEDEDHPAAATAAHHHHHHRLDGGVHHDLSETTAAADAVYQQTVAEMEEAAAAANEEVEEEEVEEVATIGEEEEDDDEDEEEEHRGEEEEQDDREAEVLNEQGGPEDSPGKRRRGRPKKS